MSKVRVPDEKPWEPTLDSLPPFNPFANPVEHLGDPTGPVILEESEGAATDAELTVRGTAAANVPADGRATAAPAKP